MSVSELHEWYEYYEQEPFLADRLEIQLATLSSMVGGFGGSKLKPNDFMISKKEKRILTQQEDDKRVSQMFDMLSKG